MQTRPESGRLAVSLTNMRDVSPPAARQCSGKGHRRIGLRSLRRDFAVRKPPPDRNRTCASGVTVPSTPAPPQGDVRFQPLEAEYVIERMPAPLDAGAKHLARVHAEGDPIAAVTQRKAQVRMPAGH